MTSSTRILPKSLAQFSNKLPRVYLDLCDIDSDSINSAVQNGTVDIGIASDVGTSRNLKAELLWQAPFGIVCRTDRELNRCNYPIKWQQFTPVKFISNSLCKLINNLHIEHLSENSKVHMQDNPAIRRLFYTAIPALPSSKGQVARAFKQHIKQTLR